MTDSIREKIASGFVSRAAVIRQANQFNTDIGANSFRAVPLADPKSRLDAISIFPGEEEPDRSYGNDTLTMLVRCEALADFGSENASVVQEQMLADMVEAFTCLEYDIPFASGTVEILPGETITDEDSGATALVISVSVVSGDWPTSDAAGTLRVRRHRNFFASGENLSVSGQVRAAANGNAVGYDPPRLWLVDLLKTVKSVAYAGGTPGEPIATGSKKCSAIAEFNVIYEMQRGIPYAN